MCSWSESLLNHTSIFWESFNYFSTVFTKKANKIETTCVCIRSIHKGMISRRLHLTHTSHFICSWTNAKRCLLFRLHYFDSLWTYDSATNRTDGIWAEWSLSLLGAVNDSVLQLSLTVSSWWWRPSSFSDSWTWSALTPALSCRATTTSRRPCHQSINQ